MVAVEVQSINQQNLLLRETAQRLAELNNNWNRWQYWDDCKALMFEFIAGSGLTIHQNEKYDF